MNCRECQMQMPEYVDGVITGLDLIQLETHVQACPTCAAALAGEQAALARFAGMLEPKLHQSMLSTQAREKIVTAGKAGAVRPAIRSGRCWGSFGAMSSCRSAIRPGASAPCPCLRVA